MAKGVYAIATCRKCKKQVERPTKKRVGPKCKHCGGATDFHPSYTVKAQKGYRPVKRTGGMTIEEAVKRRAELVIALATDTLDEYDAKYKTKGRGRAAQSTGPLTLSDGIDIFHARHASKRKPSTQDKYRDSLEQAKRYFGNLALKELDIGLMSNYELHLRDRESRRGGELSEIYIRRLLKDLNTCMNRLVVLKVVSVNPVRDYFKGGCYKEDELNRRHTALEEHEILALLEAAESAKHPHTRLAILMACETGLRLKGVLHAKVSDVSFTRKSMVRLRQKGGKTVSVPLTRKLIAALKEYLKSFKVVPEYLFPSAHKGYQEPLNSIGTSLKNAADRAGILARVPDFNFNDLRHTFATIALERGVSPYVVQQVMGHKTLAQTMKYVNDRSKAVIDGMDTFDRNRPEEDIPADEITANTASH
ncbi:MAG: tyrosine-type recombinase/integrase [Planctomycetota bacterium]|jgi:integrase/recombinase XerD